MEQQGLQLGHVGAASGEYDWEFSRPGYYQLIGPKGAGKTTIVRVLGLLASAPEDLQTGIPISHGEDRAFIRLDARSVQVSLSAAGVAREPIISGPEVSVETVPSAIQTLLDGDRCKGEETRAEHRLRALLSYAPVATTPERLDVLLGCLRRQEAGKPPADRAFGSPTQELRDLWRDLSCARKKPPKYQQLMDPAQIRAWLEIQGPKKRKGSILDDHLLLFGRDGLLNALSNTGAHAVGEAQRRLSAIEGRIDQSRRDAARSLGVERLAPAELEVERDLPALMEAREKARLAAHRIRDRIADRAAEERRREKIRATLAPERPEVDVSQRDALATQIEPAEQALTRATEAMHTAGAELQAAEKEQLQAKDLAFAAWEDLLKYVDGLSAAINSGPAGGPEAAEQVILTRALSVTEGTQILTRLVEAVEADPELVAIRSRRFESTRDKTRHERETLDRLRSDLRSAEKDVERQERDQRRWDEITAELETQIVSAGDPAEAEAVLAEAERRITLAEAAAGYQAIAAEHRAALETLAYLDALIKDYRKAKEASWDHLGQVVTEALNLSWLQVDGTSIYLGFGPAGRLNMDSAAVAEAREAARRALEAATDPDSPVAGGRFLERVREVSEIEWRLIDDNEQVKPIEEGGYALSEGELAHACLEIWFSRQPDGAIRTLPTSITAAFDAETERMVAERCVEKSMRVIGCRPRKQGDPEELTLVRVGGAA